MGNAYTHLHQTHRPAMHHSPHVSRSALQGLVFSSQYCNKNDFWQLTDFKCNVWFWSVSAATPIGANMSVSSSTPNAKHTASSSEITE